MISSVGTYPASFAVRNLHPTTPARAGHPTWAGAAPVVPDDGGKRSSDQLSREEKLVRRLDVTPDVREKVRKSESQLTSEERQELHRLRSQEVTVKRDESLKADQQRVAADSEVQYRRGPDGRLYTVTRDLNVQNEAAKKAEHEAAKKLLHEESETVDRAGKTQRENDQQARERVLAAIKQGSNDGYPDLTLAEQHADPFSQQLSARRAYGTHRSNNAMGKRVDLVA